MPRERKLATQFVLDSSIAAAWYFTDESEPYADKVANMLAKSTAIVPGIFHLEIANIILMGEKRKRSTEAQAKTFLNNLSALPIITDSQTASRAWFDTIAIARAHNLTSYDASFLELALRESIPLASLDRGLNAAAKAAGVLLF